MIQTCTAKTVLKVSNGVWCGIELCVGGCGSRRNREITKFKVMKKGRKKGKAGVGRSICQMDHLPSCTLSPPQIAHQRSPGSEESPGEEVPGEVLSPQFSVPRVLEKYSHVLIQAACWGLSAPARRW